MMSKTATAVRLPWSIATILTISKVGINSVLTILLTVVDIRREQAFSRKIQEERAELLVRGMGDVLAEHFYFNDVDALRDLASRVVESRTDIDYVQLLALDGSLLAASSKDNLQKDYPTVLAAERIGFESARSGIAIRRFKANELQVTRPIFAGANVVGVIQFGFNSVALDAELRSIIIQRIWEALALIAIGIVLSYLMARYASKPLREISASAALIGQGNLDASVPIRGARETADLGGSLAKMRDDLKTLYNDLETGVESRIFDLAEASKRLMVQVSDRKEAEESLSHRNQELEILLSLARILSRTGDYQKKCQEVLEDLARITEADQVTLRIRENEGQSLILLAAGGGDGTLPRPPKIPDNRGIAEVAWEEGEPVVVNAYDSDPRAEPTVVAQGVKSAISLPLKNGERQVLGVLIVLSLESDHFSEERVRLLTAVA